MDRRKKWQRPAKVRRLWMFCDPSGQLWPAYHDTSKRALMEDCPPRYRVVRVKIVPEEPRR